MELLKLIDRVYDMGSRMFHGSAKSIELEAKVATAGFNKRNSYHLSENFAGFDSFLWEFAENGSGTLNDCTYDIASF